MTKYVFTGETITMDNGKVLHRIMAARDFHNVKCGDLGGFIEREENLSHDGNCWVFDEAKVHDDALVEGDAYVYGRANVFGDSHISDNAHVFEDACVCDNAHISEYACVCGNAHISEYAYVCGYAVVKDDASIYGNAVVFEKGTVRDRVRVCDYVQVYGNVVLCGENTIFGNAMIETYSNYLQVSSAWPIATNIIFFENIFGEVFVDCEKFRGTFADFVEDVISFADDLCEEYGNNEMGRRELLALIELVKIRFNIDK